MAQCECDDSAPARPICRPPGRFASQSCMTRGGNNAEPRALSTLLQSDFIAACAPWKHQSVSGLGLLSWLCHDTAKVGLSPAREPVQGLGRERDWDPPALERFGLSPHSLWSKMKTCWHSFYQCSMHRFSLDPQGRHRFPANRCTCISCPVLVSRSQSLSIEGLSAILGPKRPRER